MGRRGSVWQLDGIPAIPTQNLPREKWLEMRRSGVGGSEIAGIMGVSPWLTPLGVYCDKAGLRPDTDPSIAMAFGLRMEPTLRKWTEDELRADYVAGCVVPAPKVLASPYLYQHPLEPLYLGNVDAVMILDEHAMAGVEFKTVDRFMAKEWKDNLVPEYYWLQAQWYMGITGLPVWFMAALIGKRFELRRIRRDDAAIEEAQHKASQFWEEHVIPRRMPEAQGADASLLLSLYGDPGQDIIQDEDMENSCALYLSLSDYIKRSQAQRDELGARLKQRIGEAKGLQAGAFSAIWSRYTMNKVDTDELKRQYPDVYAAVRKELATGRLTVKEIKA